MIDLTPIRELAERVGARYYATVRLEPSPATDGVYVHFVKGLRSWLVVIDGDALSSFWFAGTGEDPSSACLYEHLLECELEKACIEMNEAE